ncbi:MAG: ribonuclease III [Bacteroidales bacterium]|nr:ribonuclease III [Bacteroidales bacterium]
MAYRIKLITGFYPKNIHIYQQALTHKSVAQAGNNGFMLDNERLEYLGDAVLDAILADFLFKKFPYENEGFLTQLRSKVVNRKQLSNLAVSIGLDNLLFVDNKRKSVHSSIFGNAFEAFIGAIYLDKGFEKTYKYVSNDILQNHIDICELKSMESNYKSKLLEWVQKQNQLVSYRTVENPEKENTFISSVILEGKEHQNAIGHSKKEAEQNASFIALKALGLIETDF